MFAGRCRTFPRISAGHSPRGCLQWCVDEGFPLVLAVLFFALAIVSAFPSFVGGVLAFTLTGWTIAFAFFSGACVGEYALRLVR